MKGALLLSLAIALVGCGRAQQGELGIRDKQALQIIQRAQSAPDAIVHSKIDLQQVDIALIAPGQPPLSALEEKRYATYTRSRQADGSILLTDRVHAYFENLPTKLSWFSTQRIGGNGSSSVSFSDREWSYSFATDFPDSITRTPTRDFAKTDGAPLLRWLARSLAEESKKAQSVRLRGREISHGVLCEVIELTAPSSAEGSASATADKQMTYYVGVADGLVHRQLQMQGPPGRQSYREMAFTVDPHFVPQEISYSRFEMEVKKMLKGKPAPPVIAKMK